MTRSDGQQEPKRKLIFAEAVRIRQIVWLWKGWLPWGKLVLLEGDPDVGKSLASLDLIARATRGDTMPNGDPGDQAAALLLCAEDDASDTVKPRLIAARADLSRVAFLESSLLGHTLDLLTLPSGLDDLRSAIYRMKKATGLKRVIVVIDPITAFLDDGIDPNKDSDVRRLTTALSQLAARTGSMIILVRHLNKSVALATAKYRGSGSIAWTAAARAVYIFGNHPGEPALKVMAATKNNIAAARPSIGYRLVVADGDEVPHVEWVGVVELRADDLVRVDARKQAPQRDEASALLVELLDEGGGRVAASRAIAAGAERGLSEASMKRAADQMQLVRKKARSESSNRQTSVWELSPNLATAQVGER